MNGLTYTPSAGFKFVLYFSGIALLVTTIWLMLVLGEASAASSYTFTAEDLDAAFGDHGDRPLLGPDSLN